MAAPMRMARFLAGRAKLTHFCTTRNVVTSPVLKTDKATPNAPDTSESTHKSTANEANSNEQPTDSVVRETSDTDRSHLADSLPTEGIDTGLRKTLEMFKRVDDEVKEKDRPVTPPLPPSPPKKQEKFVTLLRQSKLMQLGDPNQRVVVGTILETMEDDLYIDFGGKFNCVCKRPQAKSMQDAYQKGTKVRIRLRDLELSSHFMGAAHDITLLEADATLLGLHRERHGHGKERLEHSRESAGSRT